MPGKKNEIPKKVAGRWVWSDGTEPTIYEWTAMRAQTLGGAEADLSFLGGQQGEVDIGGRIDGSATGATYDANGNPIDDPDWVALSGYLTGLGGGDNILDAALPKLVGPETPGAQLDLSQVQQDESQLRALMGDLQQQAATGSGAWEEALSNATQNASASAMALGQTQQNSTGGSYGASLRNIGNAQAGAQQRAVGQGNILREKSKTSAQDALSGLTSGMGGSAAEQAAATAAAKRQVQATNQALINQAEDREMKRADAIGTGMSAGMSDGGRVQGVPQVSGDDPRNDTENINVSPDEIVIPRTIATAPNAPELAKAFVMAIQQREGKGYADGGPVDENDDGTGLHQATVNEDYGEGNAVLSFVAPHIGRMAGFDTMRQKWLGPKAPSVEFGGMLDDKAYNEYRDVGQQNAAALALRAQGQGPSVVPQMMQNTSDANLEAALQAQAAGKGGADLVARTTQAQQAGAGEAGAMVAQEQQAGQQGLQAALLDQQARDLAMSKAQQQAQWQQTMMNIGLSLEQQALVDNILSGAGQGLAALSDMDFNEKKTGGKDVEGFDFETGKNEYEQTANDYDTNSMEDDYAHGGRVRSAAEMACAPGYAEGGFVDPMALPPRAGEVVGTLVTPSGERIQYTKEMIAAEQQAAGKFPSFQDADEAAALSRAQGEAAAPKPGILDALTSGDIGVGPNVKGASAVGGALMGRDNAIDAERMKLAAAKTRLGVVPEGQPMPAPAPPAPAPAPPAMAQQSKRPGMPGSPGNADIRAGVTEQRTGLDAEAAVKQEQAVASVNAMDAAQKQVQANALEAKQRQVAAQEQVQAMMAKHQSAVDEMKNINTTVDPGRYWASRSVPQRLLGIAGLVVGAFGAGRDGINKAAVMMQQAIDRDLEAQKIQYQLALQKGRAGVEGAQTAYAMAMQNFGNEVAAGKAAEASLWALAENELKKIAAGAMGPQAKAQAEQAAGAMRTKQGELLNAASNVSFDNQTQRMMAEAQLAAKAGGDPKQKAQVFEIEEREKEIQQSGSKLLGLLEKYGTQEKFAPGVEAEMNQAINGMIIASAKMQDREGVVREPDEARERKSLGFEPGFFQRSESAKRAIQSYISNADRRRSNALSVRGLQ